MVPGTVTSLRDPIGIRAEAPRVMGPLNVALSLKVASELKVGVEPARNVVAAAKLAVPVNESACPLNEVVKFVIVILDVVEFSSLMMRTSFAVMAVTAGSSLTLILANFLAE